MLLLLGLALQAGGNNGVGALPERRVISAEMIRDAGLTRVGDILLLAEEWLVNTTDGFTWRASVNGLSSFQGQSWIVMLDGQKFDLKSFDVINLNMLPVSPGQIDSVEIVSLPQIYNGEFTERGLIHIHTAKPKRGVSFQGHFMAGNETGDPGPYAKTEYGTPNIDKIGLDGSIAIDLGLKNRYARAYLIGQVHPFTDFAMYRRNSTIVSNWPGMQRISSAFRIGRQVTRGKQEFFVGYSHSSKYFLFFKPLGREIPVNNIIPHLGLNGIFAATRNTDITYRIKYSLNKLGKYPNALDFDFDWALGHLHANIESIFKDSGYQRTVGIGFDRYTLDTSYKLETDSYSIGKIYGDLRFRLTDDIHQSINTMIAISNGKAAIKGALANHWNIGSRQQVKTMISYSQRLIEEENSIWYWFEQGYDLLRTNGTDYTISGKINKSEQITGDVIWTTRISNNITVETTGYYRLLSGPYLERLSFNYNPQDCSFSSPVQIYGDKQGQIIGASIAISYRLRPMLRQRFFYSYGTAIGGDEVFREIWGAVPKHKASFQITFAPVENFSLWAMLSYLSSSNWVDYENIDGQSCLFSHRIDVSYHSTVKGSTILDLQAQKWFWHRRLVGKLLFRNVLNQDFHYHPVGASFDLSFFVQIEVLFNSQ